MRGDISARIMAVANLLLELAEECAEAEVDAVEILDIEDAAANLKDLAKRLK